MAEIREGDTVEIYGRLLGFKPKVLHDKFWMVNETQGVVAASSEVLVAHADLRARRTAPFPPEVAAVLTQKRDEWGRLDWDAPVSGAIQL
ncbi:MAG: thioesterase family protein [Candidatus Hydrogenedentes bacterium]|nr:thioesterase family protein [Candidatus Hydrogenedentota bacterium]